MAAMQRGARQGSPPGAPRGYDETIESCQPHARRQTRHISYDEDLSPSSQYSRYLYRANRQAGRQALISGTTRKADAETLKHETLQLIKGETRRDPLMRTGLLDHVFNSTRMYSTAKTTCKASIRYGPLPLFIVPSMPCLLT